MRKIVFNTEANQYPDDIILETIHELYPMKGGDYLVELKMKDNEDCPETDYRDITELVLDVRKSDEADPHYEFRNDWWEGQQDIVLLAIAPIDQVDITDNFDVN